MTSLTIHLPDELAKQVQQAGLLDSAVLAQILKDYLQQHPTPHQDIKQRFPLGLMAGQIKMNDDFDEPLEHLFECLEKP